jgi:hypothetical protein
MAVDIDGVNSTISTDKLIPQSGTALQIGESGDTVTLVGSAVGFGGGKVLQIDFVHKSTMVSGSTLIPNDNTIPQNTEGVEVMTLAFTPTSATSELLIQVNIFMGHSAAGTFHTIALFQDTTANALRATNSYHSQANKTNNYMMNHLMVAGTTSSTTFKVRLGAPDTGSVYFNGDSASVRYGGVSASSIMIMEYTP